MVPGLAATRSLRPLPCISRVYSIYSARLPVPVLPPLSGADSADQGVYRLAGAAGDGAPDTLSPQHGEIPE